MIQTIGNYAKILNTGSQRDVSPANPEYHRALGDKNTLTAMRRLGPLQLYNHIMTASFDPVYGRENSLALQEEKPATRFPLAEERRPHERSENNATAFTAIIPDDKESKNGRQPYSYAQNYRNETRKSKSYYIIASMVEALEKRAEQYLRKSYNPNEKSAKDVLSWATLDQFTRWQAMKEEYSQGSNLEQKLNF